jgi:hypothetical protein
MLLFDLVFTAFYVSMNMGFCYPYYGSFSASCMHTQLAGGKSSDGRQPRCQMPRQRPSASFYFLSSPTPTPTPASRPDDAPAHFLYALQVQCMW